MQAAADVAAAGLSSDTEGFHGRLEARIDSCNSFSCNSYQLSPSYRGSIRLREVR